MRSRHAVSVLPEGSQSPDIRALRGAAQSRGARRGTAGPCYFLPWFFWGDARAGGKHDFLAAVGSDCKVVCRWDVIDAGNLHGNLRRHPSENAGAIICNHILWRMLGALLWSFRLSRTAWKQVRRAGMSCVIPKPCLSVQRKFDLFKL